MRKTFPINFNENLRLGRKLFISASLFLILSGNLTAQITRIDPPNWWKGMPDDTLQLLVEGPKIAEWKLTVNQQGVIFYKQQALPNPNFLLVYLLINEDCTSDKLRLHWTNAKKKFTTEYPLLERHAAAQGLSPADVIYLIMPDRFANGDPKNDAPKGMHEGHDRMDHYGRHGGDLKGIINKIGYLDSLGSTALWLTPFFENNQPKESYHGYAITDHYRVDPRLGDSGDYRMLVNTLHQKDMKMVMDVVFNHIGDRHRFYAAMADSSWFHFHPTYFRSNFRAAVLMDPNASEYDKNRFSTGWFDRHMPDLDQSNPHLAQYLIQNSIWWVELFGIDAIRIDTYAYPDQDFMAAWNKAMKKAFPTLFIFGEIWDHAPGIQAHYTKNGLEHVTDFEFYNRINKALTEPYNWTDGVARLHYHFSQDALYRDASANITFLDNHDLPRYAGVVKADFENWKAGITLLMTARGIPCIFYGTEVMMARGGNDGKVREDYWGGWLGDSVNLFTQQGRSTQQNEAFDFITKLAAWRKTSSAVTSGKFTQFVPEDGVYVYFRHTDAEQVLIVYNGNNESKDLELDRYAELIRGRRQGFDPLTEKLVPLGDRISLKPREAIIRVLR